MEYIYTRFKRMYVYKKKITLLIIDKQFYLHVIKTVCIMEKNKNNVFTTVWYTHGGKLNEENNHEKREKEKHYFFYVTVCI